MGRPSKLTPVTQRRICDLIRKGVPRERASRLAGVHDATFHRWMADGRQQESGKYHDFHDAVCKAEDDLVQKAISTVHSLLDPEEADPPVRLNAAKFILSHRFNREFSQRQEVTGADGKAVQVQAEVAVRPLFTDEQLANMSPEQLVAALGAISG